MSFPFRGFSNPLNLDLKCFVSISAFHVFNIARLFEVVNYTRSIIQKNFLVGMLCYMPMQRCTTPPDSNATMTPKVIQIIRIVSSLSLLMPNVLLRHHKQLAYHQFLSQH